VKDDHLEVVVQLCKGDAIAYTTMALHDLVHGVLVEVVIVLLKEVPELLLQLVLLLLLLTELLLALGLFLLIVREPLHLTQAVEAVDIQLREPAEDDCALLLLLQAHKELLQVVL
jgi:hypothetical protein